MKIFVTGASGFLGRYVVAELLRHAHQVRVAARPTTDKTCLSWHNHPAVEWVSLDLEKIDGLANALQGIDAVIHLAAAKGGDFQTQLASTVTVTENLLKAMKQADVRRLVAISTFSVYDYLHLQPGSTIDENSPIESHPSERDGYAQTKLLQEQRVREFEQQGGQVTIIRPGMIYGRDALWNACLGAKAGDRLWLRIGADATLPLTYVENCAEAIVNAVEPPAIGQTINIVDDHLPTQTVYAHQLLARMSASPRTVLVPWATMALLADLVWRVNKGLFAGRLKLPGLLIPARLHARFKPLQYSNLRAKQILAWKPIYSLEEALDRSCSDADLLTVFLASHPSVHSS
jgi:nucleoside-diphosphate-sugar epimerase